MLNGARMWLVERTYLDNKQDIVIPMYAIPDETRYYREERSLTSFESDVRDTYVAIDVPGDELGHVADEETRELHVAAATEMAGFHEPTDTV